VNSATLGQNALDTTILLTILGFAITIIGNAVVVIYASGKTQGVIKTQLNALGQRTDKLEEDSTAQWKELSRHTAQIGYLEGKVNGKARGASQ